jgi:hypothetical protein
MLIKFRKVNATAMLLRPGRFHSNSFHHDPRSMYGCSTLDLRSTVAMQQLETRRVTMRR